MSDQAAALKTGKTFTWATLLRDHTRFVTMLPGYLAADVMPGRALAPVQREVNHLPAFWLPAALDKPLSWPRAGAFTARMRALLLAVRDVHRFGADVTLLRPTWC